MTTKIEWVRNPDGSQGYTWNPITGCLNHVNGLCKGGGFPCYAYNLAHGRLKQRYLANENTIVSQIINDTPLNMMQKQVKAELDPFYPRLWPERVDEIWALARDKHTKARGIFVCDMSDLFGIGIPEEWTKSVLEAVKHASPHRFYLLTKQAQRLIEFSPFPENAWVGVTATNRAAFMEAKRAFNNPICACGITARVKFISFEPLLEPIICKHEWVDKTGPHQFRSRTMPLYTCSKCGQGLEWGDHNEEFIGADSKPIIQWLVIGACTGSEKEIMELHRWYPELTPMRWKGALWTLQPKIESLREIVEAADKAGGKVFLKDNLRPLLIPEDCSKPNYLTEDLFWASEKAQLRQELPE